MCKAEPAGTPWNRCLPGGRTGSPSPSQTLFLRFPTKHLLLPSNIWVGKKAGQQRAGEL